GGECATFFINNTVISENMNSGLQIRNTAEAHVDSCKFVNNQAENGGGIVSNGAWIEISRTLFFGNYARNSGGAFFSEGEYLSNNLNNCVFTENQADSNGASIFTFSGFIVNSIFTGNGPSVNTFVSGDDFISYNSLYYGNESDIHFAEPDWVSEEFGIINTDNVNGDSCDQFYNLFMDPQFINPLDLNFHLRENSPCIDAGTSGIGWVDSLFDPDGGTTDIGIHYYHVSEVFEQKRNRSIPSQFSVKDIYPNPFNSSITIRFGLQVDSEINLSVFNIIGQKVAQLYSGKHTAGYHTVVFNGDNLSSGIYFIHAKVPGKMDKVRKIVLVR
ncbi:MAG: T9SS type A sorting domain-containing protein, partial [Candidatus Electryonea clarkiae]|nr:T9SS type A sorting domain-containing protein [Candidatus Electryonea clarkiae]